MPKALATFTIRKFISLVSVHPPIMAMPSARFTVLPCKSFWTKILSRVSFTWRAISFITKSQDTSSQWEAPGALYNGLVRRRSFTMQCLSDAPFGQRVPPFMGWSGSPSTWTTVGRTLYELSPRVCIITPQLTEQYGQVLLVSVVRAIFSWRAWAIAGVTSKPKPVSNAPLALSFRKERLVSSIPFLVRSEERRVGK